MAASRKTTKDRIKAMIVEEGNCWLWTGSNTGGRPAINMKQEDGSWRNENVRKVLFDELGKDTQGKYLIPQCGDKLCVNPSHIIMLTKREHLKRANAKISTITRRLASANTLKQNHKVNQQIANEIRLSNLPRKELASIYGIARRTVDDICNGTTWRTNFFTGLM